MKRKKPLPIPSTLTLASPNPPARKTYTRVPKQVQPTGTSWFGIGKQPEVITSDIIPSTVSADIIPPDQIKKELEEFILPVTLCSEVGVNVKLEIPDITLVAPSCSLQDAEYVTDFENGTNGQLDGSELKESRPISSKQLFPRSTTDISADRQPQTFSKSVTTSVRAPEFELSLLNTCTNKQDPLLMYNTTMLSSPNLPARKTYTRVPNLVQPTSRPTSWFGVMKQPEVITSDIIPSSFTVDIIPPDQIKKELDEFILPVTLCGEVNVKPEIPDLSLIVSSCSLQDADYITDSLISEVFKKPLLWDHKRKEYHNRQCVDKEWENIASNLGISKNLAISKWNSLRDKFRNKLGKPRSGDEATPQTTQWMHFTALEFLSDVMEPISTMGNIPEIHVSPEGNENDWGTRAFEINANEEESFSHFLLSSHPNVQAFSPPPNPYPTTSVQGSAEPPPSKRKKIGSGLNFSQEMLDLQKRKMNWMLLNDEENNDEDLNFFKSLMPYMKKLSPLQKLNVRSQIQNVIVSELRDVESHRVLQSSSANKIHEVN